MNDTIRMQISAFVDGELPDNESELLLRRLSQDAELRRVVARYLEVGREMRQEGELPNMSHLRRGIAAELGTEQRVEEVVAEPLKNRFFKTIAGLAVAASVAVVAVLGLQQTNAPDHDAAAVADSGSYTQPAADTQLDEMFRLHDSASGSAGSNAIITELVTLEINEADLVRVEPKAVFIGPAEIESNIDEEESDPEDETEQLTD